MRISDGIIQTIKKTTHNTSWANKKHFADFLKDNEYFVLPQFCIERVDETHDKLILNYTDFEVNAIITWKNSVHRSGNIILQNIE